MGVYYFFYNKRTGEQNEKPIPGFGQCRHVAKLQYMENIVDIFRSVIAINPEWLETDIIDAYPDYNYEPVITYENGEITYQEQEPEENACYQSEEQYNGY